MNILLIDDKANNGWKQLLEKVYPLEDIKIETAIDYKIALDKITDKYDLIFLDVRLSAEDHENHIISEYSGFKILKKIKNDFLNVNFATPIFLLTATNKTWNIDAFRSYGVDAYYIKEHPDNIFDKEVSRQNYKRFINDLNSLRFIGAERSKIWSISTTIIDKVNTHEYFNKVEENKNIRERIIDKIKIGYYYHFKKSSSVEKEILKADNEKIAFLIYFSILEELSKAYSAKKTWLNHNNFSGNWRFRNEKYFIKESENKILVNPYYDSVIKQYIEKSFDTNDYKYSKGHINLSEQIYALIYHYEIGEKYKSKFRGLNDFRNKLSYTHSSVLDIFTKPLVNITNNSSNIGQKNTEMLLLIHEILKHS
jgi:CheY-like chemotaxis protein